MVQLQSHASSGARLISKRTAPQWHEDSIISLATLVSFTPQVSLSVQHGVASCLWPSARRALFLKGFFDRFLPVHALDFHQAAQQASAQRASAGLAGPKN